MQFVAEHQRDHQQADRQREHQQAGDVEAAVRVDRVARQQPVAQHQQQRAERHVDQEDRPPAGAEQVRADQHPAEHLADHAAAGQHGGVDAQRPGPGRAGEGLLDQAHHLRHHQGRADALEQPEADQQGGVRRQPAGQRGEREGGQSELEEPAVAVAGAEPGAGDQQHRVGDRVAGDDQLQRGAGGVQVEPDGGHRDVDDGDVQDGHELAGEDEREQESGAGAGGAGVPDQAGPELKVRHASILRACGYWWLEPADPGTGSTCHPATGCARMGR